MCWDFIFDWFSLCYFTCLYILYSVLFCLRCCCSGWRAYSTPCGCHLFLLHSVSLLSVLSRALSLVFLLLCFSSASSFCCFVRCLLCSRSFCCCFVVFAFSHACFFFWGRLFVTLLLTSSRALSLFLSFALLPVPLAVCALCLLLLLPLGSQGQVNERFDFL